MSVQVLRLFDVPGYQYTLMDYDPDVDGSELEWAKRVDAAGWRSWHESGVWVQMNGRLVRRWALRRLHPRSREPRSQL